jgi:hypothetical protein
MFKPNNIAQSIIHPQQARKPARLERPKVGGWEVTALLAWVAVDDVEEDVIVDVLVVVEGVELIVLVGGWRVTLDGSGRPS